MATRCAFLRIPLPRSRKAAIGLSSIRSLEGLAAIRYLAETASVGGRLPSAFRSTEWKGLIPRRRKLPGSAPLPAVFARSLRVNPCSLWAVLASGARLCPQRGQQDLHGGNSICLVASASLVRRSSVLFGFITARRIASWNIAQSSDVSFTPATASFTVRPRYSTFVPSGSV
jgi:hypothetical protein